MKTRLRHTVAILFGLVLLDYVCCLAASNEEPGAKRLSDPDYKPDNGAYNFFMSALSNSERKKLLKISSSSEYVRNIIPKGAGYDFTVQVALYTLSESLYISPNLLYMKPLVGKKDSSLDLFEVGNCIYMVSKKTLKLLKLVRQRCFHHAESSQLKIFPKKVSKRLELYCNNYKNIEERYAKLSDFIYLIKLILNKTKIHNNCILKLSKRVWKIIKSRSFSKIKLSKDFLLQKNPPSPGAKLSKRKNAIVSEISALLMHIDNTLPEKVRILPFWISKTFEEFVSIMTETQEIVESIWSPMKKDIGSGLNTLKKCVSSKTCRSCCLQKSYKRYKLSKDLKIITNVQTITKQILSDIE